MTRVFSTRPPACVIPILREVVDNNRNRVSATTLTSGAPPAPLFFTFIGRLLATPPRLKTPILTGGPLTSPPAHRCLNRSGNINKAIIRSLFMPSRSWVTVISPPADGCGYPLRHPPASLIKLVWRGIPAEPARRLWRFSGQDFAEQ